MLSFCTMRCPSDARGPGVVGRDDRVPFAVDLAYVRNRSDRRGDFLLIRRLKGRRLIPLVWLRVLRDVHGEMGP